MTARRSGRPFYDSNILVYCDDGANPKKQSVALPLVGESLRTRNAAVSSQVLQEYFVVATRKLQVPVPVEVARRKIELMAC